MLLEIQLCLVFTCFVYGTALDFIVKLDPKQIVDALNSEISLKYLKRLVEVFGKKTAGSIINDIEGNERLTADEDVLKNEKETNRAQKPIPVEEIILNEEKAYKLLEKPSPDGDNAGWHSRELSDEEDYNDKNKGIALVGLTKVNGVYVRRLLGFII